MTSNDLTSMSPAALLDLFTELDAPTLEEMTGEFEGTPLRQRGLAATSVAAIKVRNPLHRWKSKGFRPIDDTSGRGYNLYRLPTGRIHKSDPMTTYIGTSHIDGRPAFVLDYRTFDTLVGTVNLLDDVRRVSPGVYLGFGMFGFTHEQRSILRPFMLESTGRPYSGDIGLLRSEHRHGHNPSA